MVSLEAGTLGSWAGVEASPAGAAVAVEVLRGREGLRTIAAGWRALHAVSANPEQVFLSEAWITLWHKHYLPAKSGDTKSSLILVTCRENGRLTLIWPLVEARRLGLKVLKWAGEPVSQYGDVLTAADGDVTTRLEAAWQAIRSLGADALVLRKTRADSVASRFLREKGAFVSARDEAPYIGLDGISCPNVQAEHYPTKDRKNRRRHRKRLGEIGELAFEWLTPSKEASELARLAVLLKRDWLKRRGRISKAFAGREIEDFLGEAFASGEPGLDGRVGVIRCNGRPAALLAGFLNRGYFAGFLTVYDEEFERHSPGSLLFEDVIRAAIGECITRIDLLAPADSYKADWASGSVAVEDLCVPLTAGGNIYTRVVQSRLRHSLKAGLDLLPSKIRQPLLYAIALVPALVAATSDP